MSRSSAVLETCWGSSELEIQKGIRQGSVESPLFFACLAELTLETAVVECNWPRCDPGLPDLPLSEMMRVMTPSCGTALSVSWGRGWRIGCNT